MWRAPRAVVLSATHPEPPFMPAQCTAAEAVEKGSGTHHLCLLGRCSASCFPHMPQPAARTASDESSIFRSKGSLHLPLHETG